MKSFLVICLALSLAICPSCCPRCHERVEEPSPRPLRLCIKDRYERSTCAYRKCPPSCPSQQK